jgi:hypothetical protein
MKLAEATGNLYLIATVLSGVSLRGGIVTREMFAAYWWRLETMGISDTEFVDIMDSVSGGKFTALMEAIKSLEGVNESLTGTVESQAGTIESQKGTILSQAEELAAARRTKVASVKALRDAGKSPEEISEQMELGLSEVIRILDNGRG